MAGTFFMAGIFIFCLSIIAFITGVVIIIVSKSQKKLGTKIIVISAIAFTIAVIIGSGVCVAVANS